MGMGMRMRMRRRKGTLRAMTPMKCDIIWECLFELFEALWLEKTKKPY
jgi:hypothetical protein